MMNIINNTVMGWTVEGLANSRLPSEVEYSVCNLYQIHRDFHEMKG